MIQLPLPTLPTLADAASLQEIVLGLHQKLQEQEAQLIQRDAQLAQRQAVIDQQLASLEKSQARIAQLEQRIARLLKQQYGPRSEKINENQLLLFGQQLLPLTDPIPQPPLPPELAARPAQRRKHGRRIIPDNLPTRRIVHDVPEDQKTCGECQQPKVLIRQIVTRQLELVPPQLFVLEHVQNVYGCAKGCDGQMQTAAKPPQAVEKGLAGPGLVAHVITGKYADHLPLHRLEGIFARYGIDLSRSTMCDWAGEVARLSRPLTQLMREKLLTGRSIHTDDTPVPVLDDSRDKTRQGRLWIYLGDRLVPYIVFDYTPNRSSEGPKAWLKDYGGYLQCDAYSGYEFAFEKGLMREAGCWAHARRKFYEARELEPALCHEALAFIARLYEIEREGKEGKLDEAGILQLRQEKSVAILGAMEDWMGKVRPGVLPKNPVYEALTYLSNQWAALNRYTTEGFLNIDNNAAERALRRVAIGRKNWMFAGSDEGGRTAATLYSLIASAQVQGLNVEAYLRGVFAQLPGARMSELPKFLPDVWKRSLAGEEAVASATANVGTLSV